jgi:hypothetical protein
MVSKRTGLYPGHFDASTSLGAILAPFTLALLFQLMEIIGKYHFLLPVYLVPGYFYG